MKSFPLKLKINRWRSNFKKKQQEKNKFGRKEKREKGFYGGGVRGEGGTANRWRGRVSCNTEKRIEKGCSLSIPLRPRALQSVPIAPLRHYIETNSVLLLTIPPSLSPPSFFCFLLTKNFNKRASEERTTSLQTLFLLYSSSLHSENGKEKKKKEHESCGGGRGTGFSSQTDFSPPTFSAVQLSTSASNLTQIFKFFFRKLFLFRELCKAAA